MQKVKEILKKFWSKTTVAFLIGALASAVGLTLNPATQEALACLLGATGCKQSQSSLCCSPYRQFWLIRLDGIAKNPRRLKALKTELKKRVKLLMLCIMTLFVQSCGTSISATDFCLIYTPIYPSRQDTEETLLQIDVNNAIYERLCK